MRPGGTLAYATCSLFRRENHHNIAAFLAENPAFDAPDHASLFETHFPGKSALARIEGKIGLTLSPARSHTDGFFFATLRRAT